MGGGPCLPRGEPVGGQTSARAAGTPPHRRPGVGLLPHPASNPHAASPSQNLPTPNWRLAAMTAATPCVPPDDQCQACGGPAPEPVPCPGCAAVIYCEACAEHACVGHSTAECARFAADAAAGAGLAGAAGLAPGLAGPVCAYLAVQGLHRVGLWARCCPDGGGRAVGALAAPLPRGSGPHVPPDLAALLGLGPGQAPCLQTRVRRKGREVG